MQASETSCTSLPTATWDSVFDSRSDQHQLHGHVYGFDGYSLLCFCTRAGVSIVAGCKERNWVSRD